MVKESKSLVRVEYLTASGQKRESWVRDMQLKIKNLGWRRVLICKPTATETDLEQMDVLMTNDKDSSTAELLRAWSFRDPVDKFYECAKDNLGFDQYQVRSDRPIRRHWYLVFLMYSYLIYHRQKGSFVHWSKWGRGPQAVCDCDGDRRSPKKLRTAGELLDCLRAKLMIHFQDWCRQHQERWLSFLSVTKGLRLNKVERTSVGLVEVQT